MPEEWKFYRKKPLIVEAMRMETGFKIQTLEGIMEGKPGDYIVRGIKGEKYPVDAEIFKETYELLPYNLPARKA